MLAFMDITHTTSSTFGVIQYSVIATVYLKHIHSFFNMCPLLKGVFMKMTMNLNNTTSTITTGSVASVPNYMMCSSVQNPLGGVNPLMIISKCLFLFKNDPERVSCR